MENKVTDSKILNFILNSDNVLKSAGMTYMLDGEAGVQIRILEALLNHTDKFCVSAEEIAEVGTPLIKNIKKLEYSILYQENLILPKLEVEDITFKIESDSVALKKISGWNDGLNTVRYEGKVVIDGFEQIPLELRLVVPGVRNPWEMRIYKRDADATLYLNRKKAALLPVISPITVISESAPNYRRGGKKCIEDFREILTLYALLKNEKGMRTLYETCEFDNREGYHEKHNERPKAKLKKMYSDAKKLYSREIGLEIERIINCLKIKRAQQTSNAIETHNF